MEEKDKVTEETAADNTEKTAEAEKSVPHSDKEKAKSDKSERKASEKEAKKLRSECEKLRREAEDAKKSADESNEKYLRLAAEYDNFRKRSQKEREGIYADAAADSVKELLPLIDNLERATQYTAPDKVAEGVEMILGSLPDVFAKLKIEAFGEPGEQFDPNIHNAVMHVEDTSIGENEITDVFQKGYKLGDKIIRFAMVKVAN